MTTPPPPPELPAPTYPPHPPRTPTPHPPTTRYTDQAPCLRGACGKLHRRRSAGGWEIAAERTPSDSGTLGRSLQVRACPRAMSVTVAASAAGHLTIRVPLQRFSPCFSASSHSASAEA
ncbi:hypothetical protein F9278_19765 [Streptomyces phaeolivaceus]|uniref:Uncharacterized protein n=1 Tax=Streptomyces phaeolivaceus TaxID=2653200 RepID=A0A5P8K4X8_9ACTN|nr:hypothetical protein F9278_19765 [Streptomyces phaeolivaceus]